MFSEPSSPLSVIMEPGPGVSTLLWGPGPRVRGGRPIFRVERRGPV